MLTFLSVLTSTGAAVFDAVFAGGSRVESAALSIARITVSGVGMKRSSFTVRPVKEIVFGSFGGCQHR
jgi:hypothetical protein